MIDISEITDFLNQFKFEEKGKIDNPYKAVLYFDKSVFSEEGKYLGEITAVHPDKVEVHFDGSHTLVDYPVYFGIVKNEDATNGTDD